MSADETPLGRLLRKLETRLKEEGRGGDAEKLGRVIGVLMESKNVDETLDDLYGVEGWDLFALKLMWFVQRSKDSPEGEASQDVIDYHVQDLYSVLTAAGGQVGGPLHGEQRSAPKAYHDLNDALRRFGEALTKLKRDAFDGEKFRGIDRSDVETALAASSALHAAASTYRSADVQKFAAAFSRFVRYVLETGHLEDVRVVNFIDNANLTLQTVLETVGAEDFDSLHQTIQLMENPGTLLE
jgi:hypothetical protein